MKTYVYIAAALVALWGSVALIGQIKGCKHEQTQQAAIEHPATTQQQVSHTETHTVQQPNGAVETHTITTTGSISTSTPMVPSGHKSKNKACYLSLTAGFGEDTFLTNLTNNYGVGAGVYITDWLATGIRYDKVGKEYRYAVEVTFSF